ncbi:uncharacterized protein TNCV_746751 [Trichonephila clavipes]|nr:uncharacterized protein TNCV_746751 [Trichonephila clavipes]
MKTVTYRPQANLIERVNRNLVQMIASFVEENHENWDQFLHEFAFALRTAINETTNETPAELFLGSKIITPFSKLINVTEDTKYVGRNIERLFDEARRNMRKKHKPWEKYYNRRRRDVHIKVNDLVLIQTHFLCAADRKQVGKFMLKFEGPYRVLEVKGQFKEHRKTSSKESEGCRSRQGNTAREIPRNKRKMSNNESKDQVLKRSKMCRKRSLQGYEHKDRKRLAPEQRLNKSTTVESWTEGSGRDNKTRQTRATTRGHNKQAERPVRSNQATTRRPCPYYLRSRVKENDGIPEEQRNIEINGIPHSRIRRRNLSMEALDGDPVHRRI